MQSNSLHDASNLQVATLRRPHAADASGSLSAGPSEIECRHAEQSFSFGFLLLLATHFFMVFVAWVFLSSFPAQWPTFRKPASVT